jgi:hypothetical protein
LICALVTAVAPNNNIKLTSEWMMRFFMVNSFLREAALRQKLFSFCRNRVSVAYGLVQQPA